MSTAGRCMAASTASGMTVGPGIDRNSRPARRVMGSSGQWRQMGRVWLARLAAAEDTKYPKRDIQNPASRYRISSAGDLTLNGPEGVVAEATDLPRGRAKARRDGIVPKRSLDPDSCFPRRGRNPLVPPCRRQAIG